MEINGKILADRILNNLKKDIGKLKKKKIIPTLAVIQIGNDPASNSYIRQKEKALTKIGAELKLYKKDIKFQIRDLRDLIIKLNQDNKTHGIIIQRPVPEHLNDPKILNLVDPKKDVDGFVPNSSYQVPVALAVGEILKEIKNHPSRRLRIKKLKVKSISNKKFELWLKTKTITIIGKGETAGGPIRQYFKNLSCATSIIDTKTSNPSEILKKSDIIISCVGKKRIVNKSNIKSNSILISVGIWRDHQGKLHGDYEKDEIKNIASFYSPTPGGVGPVNVACLMKNLIRAAKLNTAAS